MHIRTCMRTSWPNISQLWSSVISRSLTLMQTRNIDNGSKIVKKIGRVMGSYTKSGPSFMTSPYIYLPSRRRKKSLGVLSQPNLSAAVWLVGWRRNGPALGEKIKQKRVNGKWMMEKKEVISSPVATQPSSSQFWSLGIRRSKNSL